MRSRSADKWRATSPPITGFRKINTKTSASECDCDASQLSGSLVFIRKSPSENDSILESDQETETVTFNQIPLRNCEQALEKFKDIEKNGIEHDATFLSNHSGFSMGIEAVASALREADARLYELEQRAARASEARLAASHRRADACRAITESLDVVERAADVLDDALEAYEDGFDMATGDLLRRLKQGLRIRNIDADSETSSSEEDEEERAERIRRRRERRAARMLRIRSVRHTRQLLSPGDEPPAAAASSGAAAALPSPSPTTYAQARDLMLSPLSSPKQTPPTSPIRATDPALSSPPVSTADSAEARRRRRRRKGFRWWRRKLLRKIFGIRDADPRNGVPRSRVIHPASRFSTATLMVTGALLFYSALIVPIQLSIWSRLDACTPPPTLGLDCLSDTWFLLEVMLNFFVGTFDDEGNYVDSLHGIARLYTSRPSGFWFDLSTSVPLGFVDLSFSLQCGPDSAVSEDGGDTRFLRLIKPIRVFKLLRVLRLFKFVDQVSDRVARMWGEIGFKIAKVFFSTFLIIHLTACTFWRFRIDTFSDEQVEALLANYKLGPTDYEAIYVLCFYFMMTIFTSVGFGDVYMTDMNGRIFTVGLFLLGMMLFSSLVSQVNNIIMELTERRKELYDRLHNLAHFTRQYRVARRLEVKVRRWVRFEYREDSKTAEIRTVLGNSDLPLPSSFKVALAQYVYQDLFVKLPFLSRTNDRVRARFAAELLLRAELLVFTSSTLVGDTQMPADRLLVLHSGRLEVFAVVDEDLEDLKAAAADGVPRRRPRRSRAGHHRRDRVYVMRPGDLIGDCAAVGDRRWTGSYGIHADVVAKGHVGVISVMMSDIWSIASQLEYRPIKRRLERGVAHWADNCADLAQLGPPPRRAKPQLIFTLVRMARALMQRQDGSYDHRLTFL